MTPNSGVNGQAAFRSRPISERLLPPEPIRTLETYRQAGGLIGLVYARTVGSADTLATLRDAGLRGRGGAGYPTGVKWESLASTITTSDRGFVVVNAAEGEPGTFKDRALINANPFLVIEGALIGAFTLGASRIVIATKARFTDQVVALTNAIAELDDAGLLDDIAVEVVLGPDHYLFGEETAMLEVIEGEDPLPRHLPPYQYGLFTTSPQLGWSAGTDLAPNQRVERSNPALVNNAETFAHAALICRHGADWYRNHGTLESPGPTIVTLTGDVTRAVVTEIELGTPLLTALEDLAGGTASGRPVKAVLSGVSNPVLTAEHLDTPISYEHLAAAGGGLGSAGFIAFDDTRNMVDVAYAVIRFLHVESCGQCNPCKTGTGDIARALEQLVYGTANASEVQATIARRLQTVTDASRCYLPTQARKLIASLLQRYPEDLEQRLAGIPGDPDINLGPLATIVDGHATLSPTVGHKNPDWTPSETPVRFTL